MIPDLIDPAKVQVTPTRYGRMLALATDRYIGQALIRYGEYSESEVDLWRQILPKDAICADVGANLGAHTVALASLVPQGEVYAFEPIRFLYHLLAGNVALNGLANVATLHAGVGRVRGVLRVPGFDFTTPNNFGGYALNGFVEGNPVPLLRLDDLFARLDFLKVDVEGMEGEVLEGASRLIKDHRPILYLECNPSEGHEPGQAPSQRKLIAQVKGLGYRVWWHLAPLYNPDNQNKAIAADAHEANVVSHNILCLPAEAEHDIPLQEIV